MADLDRLIQALYAEAVEGDIENFRGRALAELCTWLNAASAAWVTRSNDAHPGEFTEHPGGDGKVLDALQALRFSTSQRELDFNPLPAALLRGTADHGQALIYAHRGGELTSIVLLRYSKGVKQQSVSDVRRALGHMVEAASLSLRAFIKRDEWLRSLGRFSRGSAALVDARGTIYSASPHFREMLAEDYGHSNFVAMASPLPMQALDGEGNFMQGQLHFRSSKRGNLYLLHARKPLPLDGLSPREQEIARALGMGKTFKTVARQCGIAVSTVANHASRIYKKLGIFRREELVELVRAPDGQSAA